MKHLKQPYFIANSGIEKNLIENFDFFLKKLYTWRRLNKLTFISCSKLLKLKNIDINLKALSNLKNIEWQYYILGDGPERKKLENLSRKLEIDKNVKFLGHRISKETLEFMKMADIFIMVSAPETFGLAYLEAMAKGCLIIGCEGWGIDGIIKNEINGFLCKPRSVEGLYDTLHKIIFKYEQKELELILEREYETINNMLNSKLSMQYFSFINSIVKQYKYA